MSGPLLQFRPGVFARAGDEVTLRRTPRHKPITWRCVGPDQGYSDPGWISVGGPRNHHKQRPPAELLTMSTRGEFTKVVNSWGNVGGTKQ